MAFFVVLLTIEYFSISRFFCSDLYVVCISSLFSVFWRLLHKRGLSSPHFIFVNSCVIT